jgi:hypothetical protein
MRLARKWRHQLSLFEKKWLHGGRPSARLFGWPAPDSSRPATKGYKGYKDGLQPESLADGNWLVIQKQPVSKIETKSDTNLRSLYESWFRNALISKSVILWWQVKKGINSELEEANTRRVLRLGKVRLHRYICLRGHLSRSLEKACNHTELNKRWNIHEKHEKEG